MSKLFELSYASRRENFVQARFGQEDVFGREDIEKWLKSQKSADEPDTKAWCGYLAKDEVALEAGARELELLPELARVINQKHVPIGADAREVWANTSTLRLALDRHNAVLYELPNGFILAFGRHSHLSALVCTGTFMSSEMTLDKVGPFRVAEAALISWYRKSTNAQNARKFLCKALEKCIKSRRTQAEAEFDAAVACSADGRKIVGDVTGVVAFDGMRRWRYPASAFVGDNKIVRSDKMFRENHKILWDVQSAEMLLGYHPQVLVPTGVLYTRINHLPEPLPAGGVELK
ncbi:MAG TPA: hypothetical protein VJB98_03605 [Candidatus Paceibacterota bacterium]